MYRPQGYQQQGFIADYQPRKPAKVVKLNDAIDQITADLNYSKLRRDLPKSAQTGVAQDIIDYLREWAIRKLDANCQRDPYRAHVALALTEKFAERYAEINRLRMVLTGSTNVIHVTLSDDRLKPLYEVHGRDDVKATMVWLARELYARSCCYGTQGIYPREYFLGLLASTRISLKLPCRPPPSWQPITVDLISAGVFMPVAYHEAKGRRYPAFRLIGAPPASRQGNGYGRKRIPSFGTTE